MLDLMFFIIFAIFIIAVVFLTINAIFLISMISSKESLVYTKYEIEKVIKKENEEELAIEFAKDVIQRRLILNGDIKWIREKVIAKDDYNKYLIYMEFQSQNNLGVYVLNSIIICIKVEKDSKTYSYKKKLFYYNVPKYDNLNDIQLKYLNTKFFSWNEEVLYQEDFDKEYNFKNSIKIMKNKYVNIFNKIINICKKIIKVNKENKKIRIISIIIIIFLGINILKSIVFNIDIIEVPNLIGMSVSEANNVKNKYLTLDVNSRGNNDEIIEYQYPSNGKVSINDKVQVKTKEYIEFTNRPSNSTVIACAQTLISNSLRSPSTTKWNKQEVVDRDEYGRYLVYLDFEAQNGFGGYERLYYYVILQDVEQDGHFTYTPYIATKELILFGDVSPYKYVTEYKSGVITTNIQEFLDGNDWNKEPDNTENN